ncbi:MAG: hypothetical protein K2X46_15520 [Roseomonas sp.]|nr:hypothetical protein [Roseomonas sp.]
MFKVLYRFSGYNYATRMEGGDKFSEGQPQFLTIPRVIEHEDILDHKSMSVANTHMINPQHNGTYVVDREIRSLVEGTKEIVLSQRREW